MAFDSHGSALTGDWVAYPLDSPLPVAAIAGRTIISLPPLLLLLVVAVSTWVPLLILGFDRWLLFWDSWLCLMTRLFSMVLGVSDRGPPPVLLMGSIDLLA